jgi:3-phosphoshikimate 1-carboxyvinyltransferase
VRFVGISNLRVKETDRIRALSTELNRIRPGLAKEEGDELLVLGDPSLANPSRNARSKIETYEDHRIAMAFALAGLKMGGVVILDPDCVGKTYPGYWDALRSLGVTLTPGEASN